MVSRQPELWAVPSSGLGDPSPSAKAWALGNSKPYGPTHLGNTPSPHEPGGSCPCLHRPRLHDNLQMECKCSVNGALSLPSLLVPCTFGTPCLIYASCLLFPGFTKDFPSGLADVVEYTCSNDEAQQVFFLHFEAHTESLPEHLQTVKGTLNRHVEPAQAVPEFLLSAVQQPRVRLHESGQGGVTQIPGDQVSWFSLTKKKKRKQTSFLM